MKYLAALATALLHATAFAATPILEYTFNGNLDGTGSVNTALTLENSAVLGGSGTGSSGLAGDGALNLTAALAMGSLASPATNAPASVLTTRPTEVNQLTSFTIQGWFKTDGSLVNGNANLFTVNGNMVVNATASGQLSLNVDGISRQSATGGYNTNSTWTFFAVTYDGLLTGGSALNVKFYVGNASTAVTQLGTTLTLDSGSVGSTSGALVIGNSAGRDRGFDGLLDNIRLYGSKTDSTGVLSLSELEAIRTADIANVAIPEPSTYAAVFAAVSGLAVCIRRRSRTISVLR